MVETIKAYARSDASVVGQKGLSERVHRRLWGERNAICSSLSGLAPSHTRTGRFRSADGQTISQPFIVALMTELAEVAPDHVVLEIGTGSGYQAAILGIWRGKSAAIEIDPPWAEAAARNTQRLRDTTM